LSNLTTIEVPEIGDFNDVEIIEILVNKGDRVELDQSLLTVESDKASMEIPAPMAGEVTSVLVKVGDKISKGSAIVMMLPDEADVSQDSPPASATTPTATAPKVTAPEGTTAVSESSMQTEVVVIGAGPGGYTAAFRAADLGKSVVLIERYPDLGGVCLNVGCIPSKALLHTAQIINETKEMEAHGISFGEPSIDVDKLRHFKEKVIKQLTGGLTGLAKQRKVTVVQGTAAFTSSNQLKVTHEGKESVIQFDNAIIAAGSEVTRIPGFPYEDDRLIDSTGALELSGIPERLLVIGGGIIGLEMSCVYQARTTRRRPKP